MRTLKLFVCSAAAGLALGQSRAQSAMEAALEKQRAAIGLQRASVRRQVRAPSAASFFTVPWAAAPTTQLPARDCAPVPEEQIGPLIEKISQREGLTPDLLRAVIGKESAFRPCAVSPKGAQGLMQLMPETASELGVEDPFDPEQNVAGGARYLRQLLARYGGDVALSLGAYNAGPGRVDAAGGLPLIPETVNFVSQILKKVGAPPNARLEGVR